MLEDMSCDRLVCGVSKDSMQLGEANTDFYNCNKNGHLAKTCRGAKSKPEGGQTGQDKFKLKST